MYPTGRSTVSDQNASFGGSCPAGNAGRTSLAPSSRWPAPSLVVVQYAASSKTLTTGSAFAQAARTRTPFSGRPHPGMDAQPLTVRVILRTTRFMTTIAVRNASVAPMMTPCTTPECTISPGYLPSPGPYTGAAASAGWGRCVLAEDGVSPSPREAIMRSGQRGRPPETSAEGAMMIIDCAHYRDGAASTTGPVPLEEAAARCRAGRIRLARACSSPSPTSWTQVRERLRPARAGRRGRPDVPPAAQGRAVRAATCGW